MGWQEFLAIGSTAIAGALSIIGVYVQMSNKQAVQKAELTFLKLQYDKLETRFERHEQSTEAKISQILEGMNEIKILITELQR